MGEAAKDFVGHFSIVRDPRTERNKLHKLESILFIAICAVIFPRKSGHNEELVLA